MCSVVGYLWTYLVMKVQVVGLLNLPDVAKRQQLTVYK